MSTDSTFNPAYRIARCGQTSAHGPHVVEHGPDQPRNCPGTGACPVSRALYDEDPAAYEPHGPVDRQAEEPAKCPNCPPGYDCESGNYLTTGGTEACDHPRGTGTTCGVCGADVARPMPAGGTEEA